MDTQTDYEAEIQLAVFQSTQAVDAAVRALQKTAVQYTITPLEPGEYQAADFRLVTYTRTLIAAGIASAIIGAGIGVAFALWLFGGAWRIAIWFGVAGAIAGAIVGSLIGLQVVDRYDADVAGRVTITAEPRSVVITTYTSRQSPGSEKVRALLRNAGATAFLDVASYQARERESDKHVIAQSTSAG